MQRHRLFEAVADALGRIARERPLVAVLDDLHWADPPTLLLLRFLVRSPSAPPMLLIGTYRDTELSRTHPLAETLADLRRGRLVERISLTGLDARPSWRRCSPRTTRRSRSSRRSTARRRATRSSPRS